MSSTPALPPRLRARRRPARPLCAAITSALASLAAAQTPNAADAPVDADGVQQVRIYGTTERDTGFAPTEAMTAGKAPLRLLETPRALSVVTRELMDSRQVQTLQQALQTVPGVSPVNFGRRGFDDINIRGFRSTESILVDGMVQSPGMWTRLTSYAYERFEVLKGASSILYGQLQPGGLVNAVSKRPGRDARYDLGVDTGSFGLKTLSADVNQPLSKTGSTALRVTAQASNGDDATDFVYRKDRWLAPALSIELGRDTDLVVFTSYSRSQWLRQQGVTPYGTVLANPNGPVRRTLFTGDPSFGGYDVEQTTAGYSLEHQFGPQLTLRHALRFEEESGTGNFVSNGTLQANRRLQNRSASRQYMDYDILVSDTSLLARADTGPVQHVLVAGLDARRGHSLLASRACSIAALDLYAPVYGMPATCPENLTSNAPSTLTVTGLYLQDQLRFGAGWTALLGLRRDRSTSDTNNLLTNVRTVQRDGASVGSAGLVKQFLPGWAAYGSWSQSFLPVSGLSFAGTAFEPETGEQWELGLKTEAAGGRITGSLAVYDLRRQNVTTADPVNTGFSVQTGEQRARGAEFEFGAQLSNGWRVTAGYAYTDAEVTRDNNGAIVGQPINLTPRHTATTWAQYKPAALPGLSLGAGLRYVSEQVGPLPFSLPEYVVADATLAWEQAPWRVTLGLKNAFDKVYYDGAINANVVSPALPRTWALGLALMY